MNFDEWLADFISLHERAGRKELPPHGLKLYLASRNELARALLKAQHVALTPGQSPRQALRAALALSVELDLPLGRVQTLTRDISAGGMSVTVPGIPALGTLVNFVLRLHRNEPPIEGRSRVVDCLSMQDKARLGIVFEGLAPESVERIEYTVFHAILALIKR